MKISEVIEKLQDAQKEFGDVKLYGEMNDGHSTFPYPVNVGIKLRRIWKGNPPEKKYFLDIF